jgi:hypothetical protein
MSLVYFELQSKRKIPVLDLQKSNSPTSEDIVEEKKPASPELLDVPNRPQYLRRVGIRWRKHLSVAALILSVLGVMIALRRCWISVKEDERRRRELRERNAVKVFTRRIEAVTILPDVHKALPNYTYRIGIIVDLANGSQKPLLIKQLEYQGLVMFLFKSPLLSFAGPATTSRKFTMVGDYVVPAGEQRYLLFELEDKLFYAGTKESLALFEFPGTFRLVYENGATALKPVERKYSGLKASDWQRRVKTIDSYFNSKFR